jgi:hypothetical protein
VELRGFDENCRDWIWIYFKSRDLLAKMAFCWDFELSLYG